MLVLKRMSLFLVLTILMSCFVPVIAQAEYVGIIESEYNQELYYREQKFSALSNDVTGNENIVFETELSYSAFPTSDWNWQYININVHDASVDQIVPAFGLIIVINGDDSRIGDNVGCLTSAGVPELNKPYIIRVKMNFATKKVDYYLIDKQTGSVLCEQLNWSMTKNGKVTNASVIDRIDSVTINSSNGQKTYVSYVKVYDTSLSVKQSSISDGQENVRNDADITLTMNSPIAPETLSGVRVKDSYGVSVPMTATTEDNDSVIKLYFDAGLKYSTDYSIVIDNTLKSKDGISAKKEQISFKTEESPYKVQLDVKKMNGTSAGRDISGDTKVLIDVKINHKMSETASAELVAVIRDENEAIVDVLRRELSFAADTAEPETVEYDMSAVTNKKYLDVYLFEKKTDTADRAFTSDRTVYNVKVSTDTQNVPEITADGCIVVKNATSLNAADSPDNVTVLENTETGVRYRYVFSKLTEMPEITDVSFIDNKTLRFIFAGPAFKNTFITVLKPKEIASEEYYTTEDFVMNPSTDILADIAVVPEGAENFDYTFKEGLFSGRYNIHVKCTDAECAGNYNTNIYFSLQSDIDDAVTAIAGIIASGGENFDENIDDFILTKGKILKLDTADYSKLTDKSVVYSMFKTNDLSTSEKIKAVYEKAVAVSCFNNWEDKCAAVEKYSVELGFDLTGSYKSIEDKATLNNMLKEQKAASASGVCEILSEYIAVELVNEAEPSGILGIVESYSTLLGINTELLAKYNSLGDKAEVIFAIKNKAFKNKNEFLQAFTAVFEDENVPGDSGGSTGSSGGSGGGSGGGSSLGGNGSTGVTSMLDIEGDFFAQADQKDNAVTNMEVFSDLHTSDWAKTAVNYLYSKGIVNGKGNGKFEPEALVTREEFVKMLLCAFGTEVKMYEMPFYDVVNGEWYHSYIATAYSKGIVNGTSENSFGIGESITREDMAVMLDNGIKKMNYKTQEVKTSITFADYSDISDYAKDSVSRLYKAGIVNGMGNGIYAPKEGFTRAMAAQVIYNLLVQ